ncbi:MAG: hypothetical protein ACT4PI_07100 [Actinomycetota bacterium]
MTRRLLLTVTAAVCAALLIAAPLAADEEEDQAIADEVAAVTADLVPGEWEEIAIGEGELEGLPACDDLGASVDEAKEGPFAEVAYLDAADEFGFPRAESAVYVFGKAKAAKRFAKALVSDDALDCLEGSAGLFASGSVEGEELELNNAAGFRLTVEGQRDVFVLDFLRVRVGRGVVTVNTASRDEPLPFVEDLMIALEEALVVAV